jgi:glycogen phosphorylase
MNPSFDSHAAPAISEIRQRIAYHLKYSTGVQQNRASLNDLHRAVSLAVREHMIDGLHRTDLRYEKTDPKRLYYLSLEFLMGRALGNSLINLKVYDTYKSAVEQMGIDFEAVIESERDAALGNGGLGRLAACFLDSLATLDMPGFGYGINYDFGLFKQAFVNGFQREKPDIWPNETTPWLIERRDEAFLIPIYGRIEHERDRKNDYNPMWLDWKLLVGVPHDMPIVGYGGRTVNFLRLFSAEASNEFDMEIFNDGDYFKAVEDKILSESVSKILYPSDAVASGRELRLVQEYFLSACAVRDIMRRYLEHHTDIESFSRKAAIQLNDTHPAITVAELMRALLDEHDLSWEDAWKTTVETLGYTNHTLMSEALEKWPVPLMERVLPRHLQIIFEVNRRLLDTVRTGWPDDTDRLKRMSIVEETDPKQVRMAHLAIAGSHSVNGVAALHTDLLQRTLFSDFYDLWPERFNNKTNGITPRRWLLKANPMLADLITRKIGNGWITHLHRLKDLEKWAEDPDFQTDFTAVKKANKNRLARIVFEQCRIRVDTDSLFDVQVKRIHEYKRQLLNALHIIYRYLEATEDGRVPAVPRTYLFGGKAAPGYAMAKRIIKLINSVGEVVNNDPRVHAHMKVVFLPDYRVSLAERIIPAADLSEQISTAGMEASGTGNMKLSLNGALTIGTLDGANVEIRDAVGKDNIYIFGLNADQIHSMRGTYNPKAHYDGTPAVKRVLDALASGFFSGDEKGLFSPIVESLLVHGDYYCLLAELQDYIDTQDRVSRDFGDVSTWTQKAILNVANMGKFSSDRTIEEYARDIWSIKPVT